MVRVGILGGTFNPPHLGHLACARAALEQGGLDRILIVPARVPPHKPFADPGPEHRHSMCALTARAAGAGDRIAVSRAELDRPAPSYTVDTLRRLDEEAPDHELTLIVGGDMAVGLPAWREPEEILELARLLVAARPGVDRAQVERSLGALRGAERVAFLEMDEVDVSSSLVRERVARDEQIADLVAPAVADYIAANGLYRRAEAAEPAGVRA